MKIITLFNHKGGVAKTTNAYNLGWMLAERGSRVILVDADSQCNLTGSAMGLMPEAPTGDVDDNSASEEIGAIFAENQIKTKEFWRSVESRNIHNALKPAFLSEPQSLQAVDCLPVPGNDNLFLLPGSLDFADYESDLALAQSLQGAFGSQRNLPGAINYLLRKTGESLQADFMIVDVSPSLGAINQNIVTISDRIVIPCSPDYFSVMALRSLASILPKWNEWAIEASSRKQLKEATYPFPDPVMKFEGLLISRYVTYKKKPAAAFASWISNLLDECTDNLVPSLERAGLMLPQSDYEQQGMVPGYNLGSVREFYSLRPKSQSFGVPAFALTVKQLGLSGTALENSQNQIAELKDVYENFARRVEFL